MAKIFDANHLQRLLNEYLKRIELAFFEDLQLARSYACNHKMSSNKYCNPRPDFSTFRWLNLSFLGIDQYL